MHDNYKNFELSCFLFFFYKISIKIYFCRSKILKDMPRIEGRPGQELPPLDFKKLKQDLQETYPEVIKLVTCTMNYSISYNSLIYQFRMAGKII